MPPTSAPNPLRTAIRTRIDPAKWLLGFRIDDPAGPLRDLPNPPSLRFRLHFLCVELIVTRWRQTGSQDPNTARHRLVEIEERKRRNRRSWYWIWPSRFG